MESHPTFLLHFFFLSWSDESVDGKWRRSASLYYSSDPTLKDTQNLTLRVKSSWVKSKLSVISILLPSLCAHWRLVSENAEGSKEAKISIEKYFVFMSADCASGKEKRTFEWMGTRRSLVFYSFLPRRHITYISISNRCTVSDSRGIDWDVDILISPKECPELC